MVKTNYQKMSRKGEFCTLGSIICTLGGMSRCVKNNHQLSNLMTFAGIGLDVAAFVYYLEALGELGQGDHDEEIAFRDHLFGSLISPTVSAINLSRSLRKNN